MEEDNIFEDIRVMEELGNFEIFANPFRNLDVPRIQQPNIYIRDVLDPFLLYGDEEFRRSYRFTKATVQEIIVPLVGEDLRSTNMRGLPISVEMQVLIALRFYATGSIQIVCGDLHFVSQPTVSRIIRNVSLRLSGLVDTYIKFPPDLQAVSETFEQVQNRYEGLRHIVGAIDCTHIKIKRPRGIVHSEMYRNRKQYFSINMQCIVGPDMRFYDILARWPGRMHDSRIFRSSRVHALLESGLLQGILVGDSGYRAETYMLTPFVNPATPGQTRYNYVQVRTRNVVERCFGVWKKRFQCLQVGLGTKLVTTANIIVACAVLHNIGINTNDQFDANAEELAVEIARQPAPVSVHNNSPSGLAFRNTIVGQYYE